MLKLKIRTLDKPFRLSKEELEQFKGVLSKSLISKMRREAVECPVKQEVVPFIKCFSCDRFVRRVKGEVYCKG